MVPGKLHLLIHTFSPDFGWAKGPPAPVLPGTRLPTNMHGSPEARSDGRTVLTVRSCSRDLRRNLTRPIARETS